MLQFRRVCLLDGMAKKRWGQGSQRGGVTSMDKGDALMWRNEGHLLVKWMGNPMSM